MKDILSMPAEDDRWMAERAFILVPSQALVARWLETFKEVPDPTEACEFQARRRDGKLQFGCGDFFDKIVHRGLSTVGNGCSENPGATGLEICNEINGCKLPQSVVRKQLFSEQNVVCCWRHRGGTP
jgi:hypothetical protein